ncbi:GNAT family N-acetyltransferase [Anaerosporobacter faecicola]|uniref:GNAT family N-acetyltransferase n=1 Tax=Anaerosporobacter faecicola TaxID=2718714 RepID=UPI00143BFB6A|nr:GNAT family N-acetyltransferase [Anaerosporobacter faecicola]
MEEFKGLQFIKVTKEDVMPLTAIMKRAFDEDTKRHLGEESGGPDGYDNGEFIQKWYIESGAEAYKIVKDGVLVGGCNVFLGREQENFLGSVFLDPSCQDKGYGTCIWKFIEQKYPDTRVWRTETPGFSKRNHNFYVNKCGFHVVKIENPKDKYEENYILEKVMKE